MNDMTIAELDEETGELAYPVLKELRPHLTGPADFLERLGWQKAEGYRLVGSLDAGGAVVAAAGFRVVRTLAWGRSLYLDDLCTLPAARRQGHGRALLAWIDNEARRLGCEQIHLDSGPHPARRPPQLSVHRLRHRRLALQQDDPGAAAMIVRR